MDELNTDMTCFTVTRSTDRGRLVEWATAKMDPAMTKATLIERDRAHLWHPYTQMATAPPPLPIVRAKGVYLYTEDGRRLLDGTSSWWVNIHGHSHPRLNRALAEQAQQLEHVMFAGCTHAPAVDLAERLVEIAARRADARLLLRQRVDGRRSRVEARAPVLAQPRSAGAAHVHHAASCLSRRHGRRDVGQRGFGLYAGVRAAAVSGDARRSALLLSLPARSRAGDAARSTA